ncbi:MAG: DUF488 family protein, partial [Planctomycetaceae bacterium]|nr:DUF488 family protein [Planctomycetaceae bacterium]
GAPAARGRLEVLDPARPARPRQLTLPWIGPSRPTIVSVGMWGLDSAGLVRLLRYHEIRRIADVRVSASFSGPWFDPDRIMAQLRSAGVVYRRWPALGNRFIGDSSDDRVVLDRYARYLETREDELRELAEAVRGGPLLLLGWDEPHAGSERELLVDALSRVESAFEVIVVSAVPRPLTADWIAGRLLAR